MKKDLSHQIAIAIMRISFIPILILVLAFCAKANDSNGQQKILDTRVTLKADDEEIKKIFTELEKRTDVKFVYSPEIIESGRRASIDVKKKELSKILSILLLPLDISYEVINNNYIILKKATSTSNVIPVVQATPEEKTIVALKIKGRILSSVGLPLEGVSVVVKNSEIGTVTNASGDFSLSVPDENAILVISYVGYQQQEIRVGRKSNFDIKLLSTNEQLNEVVVIGYGTQKKVTLTGSVASVKGEELKAIPTGSVTNTLAGRLPGLIATNSNGEPGSDDSRLLIRGNNTLGDNSPLIVVDGVADRAGGFSRIDVNDIESVSILKDASAAIYGSRAANGVILVTTKRGKAGKTKIGYSFNYGLRSPTVIPKMVNAPEYATGVNDIVRLIDHNPVPKYTDAEIKKFADGSDPINYPNIDPIKASLRNYSQQNRHNLTITGGTENVKYFTSLGYQYENNIFKHSASNYKQYNLRSNIDVQANKDLRFYLNFAFRQEDRNAPFDGRGTGEIWRNIIQGDPTQLLQYPNGLLRAVSTGGYNPLTNVDGTTGYTNSRNNYVNADIGFNWDFSKITKGLSIDGRVSFDKSNGLKKSFNKSWVLYTLNNVTGNYDAQQYGPTNATLDENMTQGLGITENIRLLYSRVFKNVHNVSGFVAYEQYENKNDYLQAGRTNYVSTTLDQIFAGDPKTQVNDGTAYHTARKNYFGRVDYSYAEKYLLQFNWRYDGSQNFPSANRYGFFPGVSAGWRISEEKFWKEGVPFVNYFKIKGSWGRIGNDKVQYLGVDQNFAYLTNYTFANNAVFGGSNPAGYTGLQQIQTANPNIHWEVGTTYNIGLESKFLNNAFTFELDVFKQSRNSILAQPSAAVPLYTGLNLPPVNDASTESKGFEVSLNYTKKIGEVRLDLGSNFTFAKSKVLNKNEAPGTPDYQKQAGKPINANFVVFDAIGIYRTAGDLAKYPGYGNVELGDLIFRDVNGDGVVDDNDKIRSQMTDVPQIMYGINMGASWRNFDLNLLWQGAGNVQQYVFYEGGAGGIGTWTKDYFNNRWTPENPNSKGPRIYDRERIEVSKPNNYFLHSAAYLRLKNVQLSYSLPKKLISALHISNCNVFVSGFNVLTITKLKDIDPEASSSGQGYAGWFNIQNKVYNFGLNLTF
ncbi:MAG: TonB-dependent receptor [Chitinophagaceae bacterium]